MVKMQFGSNAPVDMKKVKRVANRAKQNRKFVVEPGLETGAHAKYDYDVKFENIKPTVNVTRTKLEPDSLIGVAKGAIMAEVPITVPSNDAASTMHAMKKRCDHAPSIESIEDFRSGHSLLMGKFLPMPEIRMDSALLSEYLAKCSASKAERLLAALADHQLGVDMNTKHVFAKQEVLLKGWGAQPRVVYQGTDMYNATTGPIVMELNNRMKQVFSRSNPLNTGNVVIYACGASGEELGDIMENSRGIPIESDAKNNDGSQSAEFRKYEAMFYRKLGAPVWFVREFARNTSVRVWTRYGVAAEVQGQRWSGETTTTTGNSYVHMALMQQSLRKAAVVASTNIHGGDDYLGYVQGDSSTVTRAIDEVYRVSGMKAEVVPQRGRHHATFYRKRYVRTPVGCLPVPQFGRVLSKINIRANKNSNVNDRDYMAGKYMSAAYEHRHVPDISRVLMETSERLSEKPHFDVRQSKLAEMGGVENIKSVVARARQHPVGEFSEFLGEVYGINHTDLVDLYLRTAESCVQYCDGWTYVDKGGRVKNRGNSVKYQPPVMTGDAVAALVRVDVE